MDEINATLVKQLREKTGVGMMDCKKALTANEGDIEAAVDWLRKQGLSAAAKKSNRTAAEGLIGICMDGTVGAIVEVNSETDFVARNPDFQNFVEDVSSISKDVNGDIDAINSSILANENISVADRVNNLISTIGENIELRRAETVAVKTGVVCGYMHNSLKQGLGKIGVLVGLESAAPVDQLEVLGRQLAMHIAAANPRSISPETLPKDTLERERNILAEQAAKTGKPQEIIQKMLEGRLRKFYEEVCLLEQIYVIDGETKVKDAIEKHSVEVAEAIEISGFVRFSLGEGI
ncbi:MAG: translation elongation factor Ts, partial [Pseudomonadota bacterium]|nr:translation elongation factor Ts [Pseudomonadota bacterium]